MNAVKLVTGKPMIDVLNGHGSKRRPVWLMRQAGRYLPEYRELRQKAPGFLDFCFNPDLCMEAAHQPLRRFDLDAAILFSDILVVPHALGQGVTFKEGEGPVLDPVRRLDDVERLNRDGFLDRLRPVFETVKGLSETLADPIALIGFAGAPWTVATYMIEGKGGSDWSAARQWAMNEETAFGKLIDCLVDVTSSYLIEQVRNGAEVLQIFDTWAGAVGATNFDAWVIEPTRRIIDAVHGVYPDVPVIGFPRGAGIFYEKFIRETGVAAVSMDAMISTAWARKVLQPDIVVQGNLDNLSLVAGGRRLEEETRLILDELDANRHIFNLGHGILPHTPFEHVKDMIDVIRKNDTG